MNRCQFIVETVSTFHWDDQPFAVQTPIVAEALDSKI